MMKEEIICFDAEMADEQKLIELSVFNADVKEIYHSYFNPGKVRVWREEIHHITEDMVKDAPFFRDEKRKVQSIINSAKYLVGCAIKNDIDALKHSGVNIPVSKKVVEIQHWHWLLHDMEKGESFYKAKSLLAIAQDLGISFSETEAHGASADTRATLLCFLRLKKDFEEKFNESVKMQMPELMEAFDKRFGIAHTEFLRSEARGFVQLLKHDAGRYTLKFNQKVEKKHAKCEIMIEVADRFIAEMELRKLFSRRELKDNPDYYRLTTKDIEKFSGYSNEFDEERSAFCKQFTSNKLSRYSLNVTFR
ncbi:MAG: 3'-5' exonuclease [Prevotella sp.]|nr:3'-5' exonuclease [Bacteroides sp.]MCM1366615.1 3'-5' exonuclease [Prevotella sp.]MCM1437288.1 3'-5' exonuclease [Prevotella sp.]